MGKRPIELICTSCNLAQVEYLELGEFLYMREANKPILNSTVEILKERPGQTDLLVRDVRCDTCGCCGNLRKVK